ncbi:K+-channel ERG and related proteins [Klebsormidium nitens]|uniref:K+-channel ERG and related proteins n=1 Tax=Klebsormidium nitens TaxID=105231 RepID=A0A1Y1IGU8_KLENI|nr:K+-channel ERG and related proteins [Klebsormidium nitens]|eukprot:GAQ90104.1 K+-channel ERG and related proteins [Klebsormidium nitens]
MIRSLSSSFLPSTGASNCNIDNFIFRHMALDGQNAAAGKRSSQSLQHQGSVELATPNGSKKDLKPSTVSQPPLRRLTEPSADHPHEDLPHRSRSLKDVRDHTSPPLARRASIKELAEVGSSPRVVEASPADGQNRRWFGRKGEDKLPGSQVGGTSRKEKGWGLAKVVARHQWLTDDGEDDKRRIEPSDASAKGGSTDWRKAGLNVQRGLAFRRPSSRRGSDSDDSSRAGHSAKGESESADGSGGGSRQVPPAVPRMPPHPTGDAYRNHYLPHGPAEAPGDQVENLSAPVKFFAGGSRAREGGLEDAAWLQEKGQTATSQRGLASEGEGGSLGPSMGSIAEHDSSQQLLHSEIEAVRSREESAASGPRKSSFRRESSTAQAGFGEERSKDREESGTTIGRQRDAGLDDGKRDPFDNQFDPLPGTEAYGMTQVEDEDTFQQSTQEGHSLGAHFKTTWQDWQTRYKGVDAEQYAPNDDGSHGGSSVREVRHKHWSEWLRPPMIHPFSRAHRDINLVITVAIVYTMLSLPFQLCFDVSLTGGWLTIEFLVDVIFLVDVAMNFRTGYVEKQRDEMRDGLRIIRPQKIVMRPQRVARHYLRTWFAIDLVSSLPYDLLLVANVGHSTVNIVQFLRLFRLFRLHRLMLAQAELQETWTTKQYEIVEMVLLIFYLVYLAHVGACIFVAIGRLENSPQRWLEQFSWNRAGEAVPLAEARPFVKYSAALYWSVITVTSVGYGDIYPSTTRAERIFATLFITVVAIFLGYVGGNIAALLILRGQRQSVRREKFSTLHAFIDKEDIPDWLATRITVHMTRQWNLQAADFDEEQMLQDLTDELRMDLMVHWWRRTVVESDLFPHKRSFLTMLLEKCKAEQLAPGSVLCQAGEVMRHVYILRHGTMKITRSDDLPASSSSSTAGSSETGSDSDGATRRRHRSVTSTPERRHSDTEDPSSSEGPPYYFIEPGTVIGERCLTGVLVQTKKDVPAAKEKDTDLKSIRVKNVRMDLTATCEDECTVLGLLISDLFDVLERFPTLVEALRASLRDHLVEESTTLGTSREEE